MAAVSTDARRSAAHEATLPLTGATYVIACHTFVCLAPQLAVDFDFCGLQAAWDAMLLLVIIRPPNFQTANLSTCLSTMPLLRSNPPPLRLPDVSTLISDLSRPRLSPISCMLFLTFLPGPNGRSRMPLGLFLALALALALAPEPHEQNEARPDQQRALDHNRRESPHIPPTLGNDLPRHAPSTRARAPGSCGGRHVSDAVVISLGLTRPRPRRTLLLFLPLGVPATWAFAGLRGVHLAANKMAAYLTASKLICYPMLPATKYVPRLPGH